MCDIGSFYLTKGLTPPPRPPLYSFLPLNLSSPFLSPRHILEESNREGGGGGLGEAGREGGRGAEQWGQRGKNSVV